MLQRGKHPVAIESSAGRSAFFDFVVVGLRQSQSRASIISSLTGYGRMNLATQTSTLASAYKLPAIADCEIKFRGPNTVVPEVDGGINTDAKYEFARASGEPLLLQLRG